MCVKIKLICRLDRLNKDNTAPLFLRFTKDSKIKYQSLGFTVPVSAWNRDTNELINNYPSFQKHQQIINNKIADFEKQIKRLEILDIEVSLSNLLGETSKKHTYTVTEYFSHCIERLEAMGKVGTASKYRYCNSLFNQFCPAKTRFEEIDLAFLQNLELFLRKRGNKNNSIATKFSVLKAVYNKALSDGVFIAKSNPFQRFKVGSLWTPTRKRAITKSEISKFMDIDVGDDSEDGYKGLAKDIFLFSYFTAGMNFKDIACLRFDDIMNDRVYYARHKTKKEMSCRLIVQAKEIIAKYSNRTHTDDDYIFPILDKHIHVTEQQIYNRIHKILTRINRALKELGKAADIKLPLSTYVARHTFATVLKRSGVDVAIISEALGHSDITTTDYKFIDW